MALLRLLTFPVSAPLSGSKWLLQTLLGEAERRYYDEEAIRSELAEAQRLYHAGTLMSPRWNAKKSNCCSACWMPRLITAAGVGARLDDWHRGI
jgi:hypothetical protein